MKKIIISILIVILIIIAYLMIAGTFKIGNISIKNIQDIKALDESLTKKIDEANQITSQEYVSKVENLKTSIKKLVTSKEKYEKYNSQGELGTVQIKTYKIEYLWTIVGQYAKDRNTQLSLDLVESSSDDLYDLNFTLIGSYTDITDCLSDIEDDDSFDFKITNFEMVPYTKIQTTTEIEYYENTPKVETFADGIKETMKETPYSGIQINQEADDETVASSYNPKKLIATFQVEDVGIDFN